MRISKGSISKLKQYYELTKRCASDMISKEIFQWNSTYPSLEILESDIKKGQMWELSSEKQVKGIIVLTPEMDEEYKSVKWLTKNEKNLYIHRLAVDPDFQGRGYARKLMDFAEKYAADNKFNSIRLDTFSQNKRNQKFYEKRNYTKLGTVFFPNQSDFPFFCYEKIIHV
jgi:ribosomal protein S18 acetylase RimI-like enzyme